MEKIIDQIDGNNVNINCLVWVLIWKFPNQSEIEESTNIKNQYWYTMFIEIVTNK